MTRPDSERGANLLTPTADEHDNLEERVTGLEGTAKRGKWLLLLNSLVGFLAIAAVAFVLNAVIAQRADKREQNAQTFARIQAAQHAAKTRADRISRAVCVALIGAPDTPPVVKLRKDLHCVKLLEPAPSSTVDRVPGSTSTPVNTPTSIRRVTPRRSPTPRASQSRSPARPQSTPIRTPVRTRTATPAPPPATAPAPRLVCISVAALQLSVGC